MYVNLCKRYIYDKKKFVKLKFNENEGVYDIKGSSYTGKATVQVL